MNELLVGGKADGVPDKVFSEKALKKGMRHESEHTKNKKIQKEIAKDHLAEDPKYYEHLDKVEKMAFVSGFEKVSKALTAKGRKHIKEENFALPGRRYPIHDASHARNALARVAQHGSPAGQAIVRAAVRKKYPNIGVEKMGFALGFAKVAYADDMEKVAFFRPPGRLFGAAKTKMTGLGAGIKNINLDRRAGWSEGVREGLTEGRKSAPLGSVAAKRSVKKMNANLPAGTDPNVVQKQTQKIFGDKRREAMDRLDRRKAYQKNQALQNQPFYKKHPFVTAAGAYMGARMLMGGNQEPPPPPPQVVQY